MARKLEIEIVGDASSARKALLDVDDHAGRLGRRLGGLAKAAVVAGGVAGLAGIAVGAKKAIDAASNLNESINAVNVVFGKSSKQVLGFTKTASQLGLSMREANELVTPIGATFRNAGYGADAAAKASVTLAKRAADMASVFNTTVPDALEAVQAGLRGEADPLERFGVGLADAAVKAKAAAMGFKEHNGQLDAHAKAQARVALILEQTNKLQGDFANTSGGLANQQRILKASLENLAASIGQMLLPIMETLVSWITSHVIPALQRLADWVKDNVAVQFKALGDVLSVVMPVLQGFAGLISTSVIPVLRKFGDVARDYVLSRIRELAVAIQVNMDKIQQAIRSLFSWVQQNIFPIVLQLRDIFVQSVQRISAVLQQNGPELQRIFDRVGAAVKALATVAIPILRFALVEVLPRAISGTITALDKLTATLEDVVKAIQKVVTWIGRLAKAIQDTGVLQHMAEDAREVAHYMEKIAGWLQKINNLLGKIPGRGKSLLDLVGGDPKDPSMVAPPSRGGKGNLMGASPVMQPFANLAASFGLHTTSGLRPGARTKHGTLSDHAIGKALDESGPAHGMAAFFQSLLGNPKVKQAFYDPLGSIFGGVWNPYREGGHSDHVHVATYGSGGVVPGTGPQLAMVHGGETILPTHQGAILVQLALDGRVLAEQLVDPLRSANQKYARANGRGAFG